MEDSGESFQYNLLERPSVGQVIAKRLFDRPMFETMPEATMRLILGLLKGAIIGGGLGFGFMQAGSLTQLSFMPFVLFGLIGALVGFIAGKPFWRHETIWTPVVKAIFGALIGIGLYYLAHRFLGNLQLGFLGSGMTLGSAPYVLGAVIGAVYGIFVEIDDGGKDQSPKKP
jgi:hypothetical protein